jgi:YVTN family beta-propeller protein
VRTAIALTWRRRTTWPLVAIALILVLTVGAERAHARSAYLATYESDSVFALDAESGRITAGPIPLGVGTAPLSLAISPDGKTVWVVGLESGSLTSIDTSTNRVVGSPIAVPKGAYGFAITPDGTRAYLAVYPDDTVVMIDLQARQTIGPPIHVGEEPEAIAISPDGNRAYVSNHKGTVSVIDLSTNQVIGSPISVGGFPYNLAVTPDGSTLFVANQNGSANPVDVATGQVGTPIPLGKDTTDLAISPDGARAYATNYEDGTVSVIDIATRSVIGPPIPVGELDEDVTVTPNGTRVLVPSYKTPQVAVIDTASNLLVGAPTPVSGGGPIAVVPDQPPTASFFRRARARPGVPVAFDAAGSSDADGSIGGYSWRFGDGSANVANPTVKHNFAKPGNYGVTLTVTDNEGCSTTLIFTGQTAYCNGSSSASQTQTLKVAYPGVRVKCPSRARPKGCKIKLQAVTKKHKGKTATRLARAKVKAGKSKVVSLKPKKKFRSKLARAKKILVRETLRIKGANRISYRRLNVVR